MPKAKRLKGTGGTRAQVAKAGAQSKTKLDHPTTTDIEGEDGFSQLARKHWLGKSTRIKVKNDVVKKELWDVLEDQQFAYKSLLVLESLQTLERYE
jgi:intron-binding protein aquarius